MFDNVEPRYISKQNHVRTVFTPELPDIPKIFQNDFLEGFIKHPERFPIEIKRLRFWERSKIKYSNTTKIGFSFFSENYQKPGDLIFFKKIKMNIFYKCFSVVRPHFVYYQFFL